MTLNKHFDQFLVSCYKAEPDRTENQAKFDDTGRFWCARKETKYLNRWNQDRVRQALNGRRCRSWPRLRNPENAPITVI